MSLFKALRLNWVPHVRARRLWSRNGDINIIGLGSSPRGDHQGVGSSGKAQHLHIDLVQANVTRISPANSTLAL
jgi:hypothetical protein